jgi:hypothetical protein
VTKWSRQPPATRSPSDQVPRVKKPPAASRQARPSPFDLLEPPATPSRVQVQIRLGKDNLRTKIKCTSTTSHLQIWRLLRVGLGSPPKIPSKTGQSKGLPNASSIRRFYVRLLLAASGHLLEPVTLQSVMFDEGESRAGVAFCDGNPGAHAGVVGYMIVP